MFELLIPILQGALSNLASDAAKAVAAAPAGRPTSIQGFSEDFEQEPGLDSPEGAESLRFLTHQRAITPQ